MKKILAFFASVFALAAPLSASATVDATSITEPCVVCEDFAEQFFTDMTPEQFFSAASTQGGLPQDPETGSYFAPVTGGYAFFPGSPFGFSAFFPGFGDEFPCAFCQQFCPLCNFDAPQPPIPEPETYAMLLAGLIPLAVAVRRRRNRG